MEIYLNTRGCNPRQSQKGEVKQNQKGKIKEKGFEENVKEREKEKKKRPRY